MTGSQGCKFRCGSVLQGVQMSRRGAFEGDCLSHLWLRAVDLASRMVAYWCKDSTYLALDHASTDRYVQKQVINKGAEMKAETLQTTFLWHKLAKEPHPGCTVAFPRS